ncbi:MAG: YihY/virulence factor BrkB family protein, partial [Deltaproteobacteria bacterium]|nr:YihY/virulence factor BrkB family protein [Deltaproteobacteria bacterium]
YAAIGGVIFAGGIALAKFLFRWYMVVAFTRYNIIYGSLTAVVLFVVWIYYVSVILLMATEAAAVLQGRRVFHRTKGESK